jgi:hypothetical protein
VTRASVQSLYDYVYHLPFPSLGKVIGDFGLYDSLLVGFANSFLAGEDVDASNIPAPDSGTLSAVKKLRHKTRLTEDERMFLEYFDHLSALADSLSECLTSG